MYFLSMGWAEEGPLYHHLISPPVIIQYSVIYKLDQAMFSYRKSNVVFWGEQVGWN